MITLTIPRSALHISPRDTRFNHVYVANCPGCQQSHIINLGSSRDPSPEDWMLCDTCGVCVFRPFKLGYARGWYRRDSVDSLVVEDIRKWAVK